MKKIPYGTADFDYVIQNDFYYVDKSKYIKTVEDCNHFIIFVRPSCMGKSMFTNMMMSYYDIAKKDRFEQLFGNLWIGKHPTPLANKFLVLKLDFSQAQGSNSNLAANFRDYCFLQFKDFFNRYSEHFTPEEAKFALSLGNENLCIVEIINLSRVKGLDVYLFIDEYDNFTNVVLSARGVKAHEEITHSGGFYRDFFKVCKDTFRRIFLSGVTPITYDDLTSGFSIADVVALKPQFDHAVGVTEDELRQMIEYYRSHGCIAKTADEIVAETKPWYDNFCFAESCYGNCSSVYNTNMIMRYMQALVTTGLPPREMIDRAASTDPAKLNYLVMAEDLDNRERRIEIVNEICSNGYIIGDVHEQFPAYSCGNEENFKSMLFYFGTLTYGGRNEWGETMLRVPNKNMGELYLGYLQYIISSSAPGIDKEIKDLQEYVRMAALTGNWEPLLLHIGKLYKTYSSLRNSIKGKADIQGFLRGVLCLNKYFAIWPELELGKGFCDILLAPHETSQLLTRHSYLIEIKYMKAGQSDVDKYIAMACDQLDAYASEKRLYSSPILKGAPLTKLYLVFRGQELAACGKKD